MMLMCLWDKKDISKLMPPAGTWHVHPIRFGKKFQSWENTRAVQIGSSSMLAPAARFLKKAGQKLLLVLLLFSFCLALSANDEIQLNQLGYYSKSVKHFVVVNSNANTFEIRNTSKQTVFKGNLIDKNTWELSKQKIKTGDFSPLQTPGTYTIFIPDKNTSHEFEIKNHLYSDALKAALKSYYYQRASMPLEEKYAGKWHRPMGHPDDKCLYHPSSGHTEGTRNSPGGWYDAGDCNKYIVNAGVTVCIMLALHEQFPQLFPDNSMNIPESGNNISDLLNELKYELDWVLTMQDLDGGVFFKLTTKSFPPLIMPHQDTNPRYIVGKATASTLNFAAMTAQAARVYKNIDKNFSQKCLTAAQNAWDWAVKNKDRFYKNPPDIRTGEYGDDQLEDEFFWAAAELFITTKNKNYLPYITPHFPKTKNEKKAGWKFFLDELGCFSLASVKNHIPTELGKNARSVILREANELLNEINTIPYRIPMNPYAWGSNGEVANDALVLAYAYIHTREQKYLDAVVETVDYLFGKNATGYSFLTGYGDKTPQNPHFRTTAADNIPEPIPGFLVGGPNHERQDHISKVYYGIEYPQKEPARSYVDLTGSYASNEVCLNWNAPLVFVLGFLESNGDKFKN